MKSAPLEVSGLDELRSLMGTKASQMVESEGRVLRCVGWRVRSQVRASHIFAAELQLSESSLPFGMLLGQSKVDRLTVRDCSVREGSGFFLEDCIVDCLDIREFSGTVALLRCQVASVLVHDVDFVVLQDLSSSDVRISQVKHKLDIELLRTDSLRISDVDSDSLTTLKMSDISVRDSALIVEVSDARITIEKSRFADLTLRSVRGEEIRIKECSATGPVSILDFQSSCDTSIVSIDGRLRHDVVVICAHAQSHRPQVLLGDLSVKGDMEFDGCQDVWLVKGHCGGTVRTSRTRQAAALFLGTEFALTSVEVPPEPIRTQRKAVEVTRSLLGGEPSQGYRAVMTGLQGRGRDQDQIYFALRCSEARSRSFSPIEFAKRRLLGYGVRLFEPLLALIVGILATAAVLYEIVPEAQAPHGSLALAAQLWFNVGAGLPEVVSGPGWGIVAVLLAASGLCLVTTIIGIGIRRLVR